MRSQMMRRFTSMRGCTVLLMWFGLTGVAAAELSVQQAWSRALPPVSNVGAVYLTVVNSGEIERHLVAVHQQLAARAELHAHVLKNGMMNMRKQASAVIKSGGKTAFVPGGLHVMLFGLSRPLSEGLAYPITLEFANGERIYTTVEVRLSAPE